MTKFEQCRQYIDEAEHEHDKLLHAIGNDDLSVMSHVEALKLYDRLSRLAHKIENSMLCFGQLVKGKEVP
jgi:hypothetical protein